MRVMPGLLLALLTLAAPAALPAKPPAVNNTAPGNVIDSWPSVRADATASAAKPDAAAADNGSTSSAEGFTLPAWLTEGGLPVWAWPPLVLIGLVMVRRLFGRGGDRPRDLLGPPPSMRPGSRPAITPPPPRPTVPPSGPQA